MRNKKVKYESILEMKITIEYNNLKKSTKGKYLVILKLP